MTVFNVDQLVAAIGTARKDSTLLGEINSRPPETDKLEPSEKITKSYIHYICGLLLVLISLQSAHAIEGVITERLPDCAYFIVKTDTGYAVMEWNGESKPDRNDRLLGNFSTGAMNVLDNATRGGKIKVWIEGYPLSYDEAIGIYKSECK